jgi:hypothetical protein
MPGEVHNLTTDIDCVGRTDASPRGNPASVPDEANDVLSVIIRVVVNITPGRGPR